MRETIRFGKIAGVPVGAHWSVPLMMVIVAQGLAGTALPSLAPGHGSAAYWPAAVFGALLFAASLLAHELAHAVVARRTGVPVRRITLWMLGGVSLLDGDARTPRAALLIAAAGPATSLGLGAGSAGAAFLLRDGPDLVAASAWWLAVTNVILGLFNLLPGVPLDGGRIVRALLWRRVGDPERASVAAARAGLVVGALLTAGGIVELFLVGAQGLWLVAVGYFIALAAAGEGRQARSRLALRFTVAEVMRPAPTHGAEQMSVAQFLTEVGPQEGSVFPVLDPAGRLTGVVSLSTLVAVPAAQRESTALGAVAIPVARIPQVVPTDRLADLRERLSSGSEGVALVVDGDRVVGLVTSYDVERAVAPSGDGGTAG